MQEVAIFWFRRDLRLEDNTGLYHALKSGWPVVPVFIFDTNILDKLEDRADARVTFIHEALQKIQDQLQNMDSTLEIYHDEPVSIYKKLLSKYTVKKVFANHDYEPYARDRDESVAALLNSNGICFQTYKDQVILEKDEVLKDDGKPYTIFTPYSRKWKLIVNDSYLRSHPTKKYFNNFYRQTAVPIPSLSEIGFNKATIFLPTASFDKELIIRYNEQRDFPAVQGTSKLSVHLRFGTLSIRQLVTAVQSLSTSFLNELIWRDFYHMILWHFPHVGKGRAFKPQYDAIEWRRDEGEFEKWCNGQTGYLIVDAGMRELNETGFMHNRVRMITASFLVKHLLLDWRLGEAYFAQQLLDFDLAANNGGWQWAAGSGCDAAPYFRIFNPYTQTKKFDPQMEYIKKWVPEFQEWNYPAPVIEHETARKRCLEVYAKALRKNY